MTEEKQVTISNKLGLHIRAAEKLVREANRFNAEISLQYKQRTANAKSIMDMVTLAAKKEGVLTITAEGEDATTAIDALVKLINDKFGEKE